MTANGSFLSRLLPAPLKTRTFETTAEPTTTDFVATTLTLPDFDRSLGTLVQAVVTVRGTAEGTRRPQRDVNGMATLGLIMTDEAGYMSATEERNCMLGADTPEVLDAQIFDEMVFSPDLLSGPLSFEFTVYTGGAAAQPFDAVTTRLSTSVTYVFREAAPAKGSSLLRALTGIGFGSGRPATPA